MSCAGSMPAGFRPEVVHHSRRHSHDFAPDRSMRQHRSISSICAKSPCQARLLSLYSSVRTIRAAPVAQNISIGVSYWPWSASTCENMRPRQYGYPFLSMNPPEAPAYSKCVLSL